jgi:uncharacterized protein YheU (UPF0270 family)
MMDDMGESSAEPVEIPYSELSEEALRGVVEHFVLREGTDYGRQVYSLDEKVEQVLAQLRDGRARIVFDTASETVDIVIRDGPRSRRSETDASGIPS